MGISGSRSRSRSRSRSECRHTFRLAIFAQERRVAYHAIERGFQLDGQLEGLLKVVGDEFLEDGEARVVFEEGEVGLARVGA